MHEKPRKLRPYIAPDRFQQEQDPALSQGDRSWVRPRRYEYQPYVKYVAPPKVFGAYEPEHTTIDTWTLTKSGAGQAGTVGFILGRAAKMGYVVVEDREGEQVWQLGRMAQLVVYTTATDAGEPVWTLVHRPVP